MTSLPILFNGAMVRAVLDGRKTQTRRPINSHGNDLHIDKLLGQWGLSESPVLFDEVKDHINQYYPWRPSREPGPGDWLWTLQTDVDDTGCHVMRCPFGKPGDTLWVREKWQAERPFTGNIDTDLGGALKVRYHEADHPRYRDKDKWRSSTHMPREFSRITLQVKRVWVERVQDISKADAEAEGVSCWIFGGRVDGKSENDCGCFHSRSESRPSFQVSWDEIYAKRGLGWDVNPFVWCCEFETVPK